MRELTFAKRLDKHLPREKLFSRASAAGCAQHFLGRAFDDVFHAADRERIVNSSRENAGTRARIPSVLALSDLSDAPALSGERIRFCLPRS